jgi:hypothetical protein
MSTYDACHCGQTLVAKVQACIDQAVGIDTLQKAKVIGPTPEQWAIHYRKLSVLLQAAVDAYTEEHGRPSVAHDVHAAEWLLKELRG